jgi:hypothetical protein
MAKEGDTLRTRQWASLSLFVLCTPMAFFGQSQTDDHPKYGLPLAGRFSSRQGWPGKSDVIGHKHISKGAGIECSSAEYHPKPIAPTVGACLVKFENGDKKTLASGQTTRAPIDGEVYLECLGDQPTSCEVGVWHDPAK